MLRVAFNICCFVCVHVCVWVKYHNLYTVTVILVGIRYWKVCGFRIKFHCFIKLNSRATQCTLHFLHM